MKTDIPFFEFSSKVIRYAFGILFILVAVKKFRMGLGGFADSLIKADNLIAQEIPAILLLAYGYIIPWMELFAGAALFSKKHVYSGYKVIALIYLSFIFGQMYNLNTSKIGTEYFPSLILLMLGYYSHQMTLKKA
ncbi:MAG: hypothetical protein P1V18_00435 [Candidatus Gracilibacteria bacterium]|nr:hypothetical protein [Candidatus Gracilibacteria bacterium]